MNIDKVKTLLLPGPLERMELKYFRQLKEKVYISGQPHFLAIMNMFASCLEGEEMYLEVGVEDGGSLISTLLNNQVQAVACDSFVFCPDVPHRERFHANLKEYRMDKRVEFYDMDFEEFFHRETFRLYARIGLYYYDADHSEEATFKGAELGFPLVRPNGLMVFDDTGEVGVQRAINHFLGKYKDELRILWTVNPVECPDSEWWNGTMIIQKL